LTAYRSIYDALVKVKKPEEQWFNKEECKKMFEAMLGEKPLPVPAAPAG